MKIQFDNTNLEHIKEYQELQIHIFRKKYTPDFIKVRDDNPHIRRENQFRKSNKEIYDKENPEHVQYIHDHFWKDCM